MELQEGGPQAAGRCVVRGYSSSLDLAFLVVSSGWSLLDQTADVSEIKSFELTCKALELQN